MIGIRGIPHLWLALTLLLPACATPIRANYTQEEAKIAVIDGFPSVRMWADALMAH